MKAKGLRYPRLGAAILPSPACGGADKGWSSYLSLALRRPIRPEPFTARRAAPRIASLTPRVGGPLKIPLICMLSVAPSRRRQTEGRRPDRFAELAFMVNEALTRGSKHRLAYRRPPGGEHRCPKPCQRNGTSAAGC